MAREVGTSRALRRVGEWQAMSATRTGEGSAPSHEMRRSELTPSERALIQSRALPTGGALTLASLPLLLFLVLLNQVLRGGFDVSWVTALAATVAVAIPLSRVTRKWVATKTSRHLGVVERDLAEGAEEWEVHAARAVVIPADHSSVDPAVCIEIGGGKLLLLVGQWMWDGDRYGAPPDVQAESGTCDEIAEDFVNRLPPPWAFPAHHFTLRRVRSGEVLSIRVDGPYLRPTETAAALDLRAFKCAQSNVLDGSLDSLATACRAGLMRWERGADA